MAFTLHANLPCGLTILALIGLAYARGIRSEGELKEPLPLEVKDPVPYSQIPKEPQIKYLNGAYAELDLSYYNLYYPKYYDFPGTSEHTAMVQTILAATDDISVCVNYDVGAGNLTLGAFICPLPFEPKQFDKCCGLDDAQFCCTSNTEGRAAGVATFLLITFGIILTGSFVYVYVSREV